MRHSQAVTRPATAVRQRGWSMRRGVITVVLLAAVAAAVTSTSAVAQRRKITLDDLVIDGNIQKPAAFFILPRSNLNLADLDRREDLKARIIEGFEAAPF